MTAQCFGDSLTTAAGVRKRMFIRPLSPGDCIRAIRVYALAAGISESAAITLTIRASFFIDKPADTDATFDASLLVLVPPIALPLPRNVVDTVGGDWSASGSFDIPVVCDVDAADTRLVLDFLAADFPVRVAAFLVVERE